MPEQATILRAFVASPRDVGDERAVVDEVIGELNATWNRTLGIRIELVAWETHSYPSAGTRVQQTLSEQIGTDYDIFIGIMWTRFGSPTGNHGSGTEEEFHNAMKRFRDRPNSVHIMFYFKNAPVSPNELDLEQFTRVHAFKQSLGNEGTYHWSFNTTQEFSNFVRVHLARVVQSINSRPTGGSTAQQSNTVDEDELGILDHVERIEDRLQRASVCLQRITEAMTDSGAALNRRTVEITDLNQRGGLNLNQLKRVARSVGDDLDLFVKRVEVEIPPFADNYAEALKHIATTVTFSSQDLGVRLDRSAELRASLQTSLAGLELYLQKIIGVQTTVESLPRMTVAFNRAKRRTTETIKQLESAARTAIQSTHDALKLFNSQRDDETV
jgi:hypothetical protein